MVCTWFLLPILDLFIIPMLIPFQMSHSAVVSSSVVPSITLFSLYRSSCRDYEALEDTRYSGLLQYMVFAPPWNFLL